MRALLCVAACAAALGCGSDYGGDSGSPAPAPAPATCTEATATPVTSIALSSGNRFVPSCAKVPVGVAVTFTNGDTTTPHTVTTDAGQTEQFDSGTLAYLATFTHTFAAAGTVRVHCSIHPEMQATIIVQ